MVEVIERHHPNKKDFPKLIVEMPIKEHQRIHGNVLIATELSKKMREYDAITKLIVIMKNWTKSYEKNFGGHPTIGLENALELKKKLYREIELIVYKERPKIKHIKGFGSRYLAGILAYAHPNRFPSLRKFLAYCGYKKSVKVTGRYSRKACSLINQTVKGLIMHKDKHYYALYLKIKNDLNKRFPTYTKGKIDGMAKNRVGTFLLKEVYITFAGRDLKGLSLALTPNGRSMEQINFEATNCKKSIRECGGINET